jgi:Cu2+-exporting ATPase
MGEGPDVLPMNPSAATAADVPSPHAGMPAIDDPVEAGRFTRWVCGTAGERRGESSLQLSGMWCAACAGTIEQALAAVDGVESAVVSAASQRASVRWDPSRTRPSELIAAVRRAGYDAVPDAAAEAREMRRAEHRKALWRLFVASFCAMQVMMFATPSYVAGPGDLADDMRQLLNWGSWVLSIPVVLFSAGPFFAGAWRAFAHRRIGMDVPVTLGVLVTFVASTGATFDPRGIFGQEVYFDSLTMFVSFLLAGRYFELRSRHRAAEALEAAMSGMPETAQRLGEDGQWQEVSVRRLRAGDHVRVALGQAFPADGVLVAGTTRADESLLTGESVPVPKPEQAEVLAGSVNVGAPVEVRVERVGQDTRFEAIVSMMRDAASQRPAMARLADRWAAPFLWVVLLLAAGAAAAWSMIDPSRVVWVAVSVLIVTCPCALSLAAPSTMVAAAGGLARRGVLLQRLDAVEALAGVRQVFFDKTGTLTEDRPGVAGVEVFDDAVLADVSAAMKFAGSLAAWSGHPLSKALAAAAATGEAAPQWRDVEEIAGQGLRGFDAEGREWRLGRAEWVDAGAASRPGGAASSAWLGRQGRAVARFEFEEALREGAAEAVAALRADGVRVTLLSGDEPARAAALAARLGADDAIGGASPQAKLDALAAAQRGGQRVAMVGDGVNDAPVLAQADVSLAMGQGALISRAQADGVIVSNRPLDVVAARMSARRAIRIVHQNIAWAAAYNAACIPLAMVGWLPPWAAGLGMALSSLLVIGNAARASRPPATGARA